MAGLDHSAMGRGNMSNMSMPGMPSMQPGGMDLNDIDYDAYLANDRTLDDPEVVRVENRGRVRLRIINGATATAYVNGSEVASVAATDDNFPDDEHLTPTFAILTGDNAAITLTLDWLRAIQIRN